MQVSVSSNPPGAQVLVDGVPVGMTPMTTTFKRQTFASHYITVRSPGYEAQKFYVEKSLNMISILNLSSLCFWLTGLSGSGKSTVGRLAAGQLRDRGHQVEVLDGDDVRQNLCAGLGFSREDRDVNVRRIAWVADLLSRNNVVTLVAAVSPYRATRDEARARMGERFVEVHVKASVDECERRDVKGLYERARAGKIQAFTGVSDPYEEPLAAELTLETESESPEESAARLVEYVEARLTTGNEGVSPATV